MAELLLLMLPLAAMVVAAIKAFGAARRRIGESQEAGRARLPDDATVAVPPNGGNRAAQWRSIRRVIEEHGRTDKRWLEYELDFAKLDGCGLHRRRHNADRP